MRLDDANDIERLDGLSPAFLIDDASKRSGCEPHTRMGCTGTGVRSDRIEDDPIHPIHCHDTCCVYL